MIISFIKHTGISKRLRAMTDSCNTFWIEYKVHWITNEDINHPQSFIAALGDVVIRETSGDIKIYNSRNQSGVRSTFFDLIRQSWKILINYGLFINQDYKNKYTQQHHIQSTTKILWIQTFIFHSLQWLYTTIEEWKIQYPLIIKPTVGAKGEGIYFCHNRVEIEKSLSDQSIAKHIIQPFIKNSSDRRVLIVWWVVLWIMKRTRSDHAFANNISQGWTATRETNPEVYDILRTMGEKIAASFQCNFVGIDIISDETDNVYRFMEINTLPMRAGFESVYPEIKVTDKVIQLCKRLYQIQQNILIIKDWYSHNLNYLIPHKALHFLERIGNRNHTITFKENHTKNDFISYIKQLIQEYNIPQYHQRKDNHKSIRYTFMQQEYPKLWLYNTIFKKRKTYSSIYHDDYADEIRNHIDKKDIILYHDKLSKNPDHVALLSTSSINFFTYASMILDIKFPQIHDIISSLKNLSWYDPTTLHKMRIYTLTHYIIWLSHFYTKDIQSKQNYHHILDYLQEYTAKHYWEISLDCKYEFLLCCKLLDYTSYLKSIIFSESKKSLSVIDSYITDKDSLLTDTMSKAEHRNTLFLMVFGD